MMKCARKDGGSMANIKFKHYTVNTGNCVDQNTKDIFPETMDIYREALREGKINFPIDEGKLELGVRVDTKTNTGVATMEFEGRLVLIAAFGTENKGAVKQLLQEFNADFPKGLKGRFCIDAIPPAAVGVPLSVMMMTGDFAKCMAGCFFLGIK